MRIQHGDIIAAISRVAYADHLVEGYKDGHYTEGEIVQYWRAHGDLSWQIECIPDTPQKLSELLDRDEVIIAELEGIVAQHVHTEPDKHGQCTKCHVYLD